MNRAALPLGPLDRATPDAALPDPARGFLRLREVSGLVPDPAGAGYVVPAPPRVLYTLLGDALAFTSDPGEHLLDLSGEPFAYPVTTDGGAGTALTAPTLPGWLGLDDAGDGTGLLSGTRPTVTEDTAYPVVLRAEREGVVATQSFSVLALAPPEDPEDLDLDPDE